MSQHDFDIANQTAPNTRADLNLALKALASTSSGVSAPTTTYANMLYYNTSDNNLYKRNEADSGWITVGSFNEAGNNFIPNSLATKAEAEVGTANIKLMTPLRTEQHTLANDLGWSQTWKQVGGSRTQNVTYQNTTGRPIMVSIRPSALGYGELQVSVDGVSWVVVARTGLVELYMVTAIVPSDHYYRFTNISVGLWSELS
jgi:hypothetical protein